MSKLRGPAICALLCAPALSLAQQPEGAVAVTATRNLRPIIEVPASIDRVYGEDIHLGRPEVNLSESLGSVPGIVAQNRQNYAQDLQISSRGFGARSAFGIRGLGLSRSTDRPQAPRRASARATGSRPVPARN